MSLYNYCDSVGLKAPQCLYSIYYGIKREQSLISDVVRYVIIRKLLDSISGIDTPTGNSGMLCLYTGFFFRKVAYASYDVIWFVV
jgi:hypothetical protein